MKIKQNILVLIYSSLKTLFVFCSFITHHDKSERERERYPTDDSFILCFGAVFHDFPYRGNHR
jgi:hypothetical protein